MKLRSFPPAVALIIATAGIIAPAWADHHEEGPQLLRVASLQIKPDMVQEWEDLTKNHINPALKKAGVPWRVIWRTATFGHTFRYTSITPLKNFAALDGDSALARVLEPQELSSLLSRIFKCVASRRVYAVRTRPDVSITPEDPDPPKMALVIVSSIVPGKQVEYERWVKDEILPALTKAGAKHVMGHQRVFGGNSEDWVFLLMADNYAEFDKASPIVRALGQEGAQKVFAKRAGVVASAENFLIRYDAGLSFGEPW